VLDSAVIPVIDNDAGEVPKAFIVKSPGSSVPAATDNLELLKRDIEIYVEQHKSKFKWLKGGVEFIDAIPRSPSGKILRRVLRDREKAAKLAAKGPSNKL
jgi:acyl-coenzyme A synthetase/AMP-(fatty) acid ligase